MPEFLLLPNGIKAETGEPATPGLTPLELLTAIIQEADQEKSSPVEKERLDYETSLFNFKNAKVLGLLPEYNPDNLSDAGWGVIFPAGTPQLVKDNLKDLLKLREKQAQAAYKECEWFPGENAADFRTRYQETAGLVEPKNLPYYLMIVGPPTAMDFEFQHSLGAVHAVGRLHFDDPQGYQDYAEKMVAYEAGHSPWRKPQGAIFSPARPDDPSTTQSSRHLALPLKQALDNYQLKDQQDPPKTLLTYGFSHFDGLQAKKQALADLFSSKISLLFTASHGLSQAYNANDPDTSYARQLKKTGALVCAEWDGDQKAPVPDSACFFSSDLPAVDLSGLVIFAFACYSAGSPKIPRFTNHPKATSFTIGRSDFISALPQAALRKGALAFIGHIDQSWGYSYVWNGEENLKNFRSTLKVILQCRRVGYAMESFNQAYLDLNNQLTSQKGLIDRYKGGEDNGEKILETWMTRQDLKSYIVVGDPAVRLDLKQMAG